MWGDTLASRTVTSTVLVLIVSATFELVDGLDNGAALTPPLGWQAWNGFNMKFNATLFRRTAHAMKLNGLLDAGYSLLSVGGSTYKHQGLAPLWNHTDPKQYTAVIVRNSSGHYQIDPNRFPGEGSSPTCFNDTELRACLLASGEEEDIAEGRECGCKNGNEGVRALSAELRAMGFSWGSYSNMAGCQVAACDVPALNASKAGAFVQQDYDLMFGDWQSSYVMVDSVGIQPVAHPGPEPDMQQYQLGLWRDHIVSRQTSTGVPAALKTPAILHDCHNRCGSTFTGPTLLLAPCNDSDTRQHWEVSANNSGSSGPGLDALHRAGLFRNGGNGLCVGCNDGPAGGCGNDATLNSSGLGIGLRGCQLDFNGGSPSQRFNLTADRQMILRGDGACVEVARSGSGPQVVVQEDKQSCNMSAHQKWHRTKGTVGPGGITRTQLRPISAPNMCLTTGPIVSIPADPWCSKTNNMWRSNTDTLQQWGRLTEQIESLVGQGHVSRPGAWAFGDCMEIGVPGLGVLTWEETKSHVALWAVCSQPLFLGNDVRDGYMQQRLIDLMLNPAMLAVNQQYTENAGDRIWTGPDGQEAWAKPLPNATAAVVVLNRNGLPMVREPGTCQGSPYPPEWCGACNTGHPIEAPCDDNTTVSIGAQTVQFDFSYIPAGWLVPSSRTATVESLECEVFDILATAKQGRAVGRMSKFVARNLPPHASRFLLLSECM